MLTLADLSSSFSLYAHYPSEHHETDTHYGDGRARAFRAERVVRSAAVAARMRLVHLAEIERSVPSVEDALHVVRIEKKSVLLPTEIRQGRIRPEVAV